MLVKLLYRLRLQWIEINLYRSFSIKLIGIALTISKINIRPLSSYKLPGG